MSKYTPGPWVVSNSVDVFAGKTYIADCDPEFAPVKDGYYARAKANARLIAAAPDLLAVCKEFPKWWTVRGDGVSDTLLDEVLDAIAKAED